MISKIRASDDMLSSLYLSRALQLKDKFGLVYPGLLVYKLSIGMKYAEALIDEIYGQKNILQED